MILKELFREHLDTFTLTKHARIHDAAALMQREKIGAVVIVEERRVIGIITDRDIALCVSLGAATPDSLVGEVMSKTVETVNESSSVEERFNPAGAFLAAAPDRLAAGLRGPMVFLMIR